MIADAACPSQLDSPPDLRYPPSRSHQQEAPIVKELWKLAFKRVSDKLEDPAAREQRCWDPPRPRNEIGKWYEEQREEDQGNADNVAKAIRAVLVTA